MKTFILFCFALSVALAANCYGPASKLVVTDLTAFPSPVAVNEVIYIRANIAPTYDMGDAKVRLSVFYTEKEDVRGMTPIIDITGLEFCNLSTSISCPLKAGSHVLAWEYTVPDVLPGTYQVQYTILETDPADGQAFSCVQFPVVIGGTKAPTYDSWYQVTLLGTALHSEPDHTKRQFGDYVQVGPAGPLNNTALLDPAQYGIIKYLKGSGELVPNPYYDTSNFVWGLTGKMTKQNYGSKGYMTHIYEGECYLGYINKEKYAQGLAGNYYDYVTPLIEGTFWLNWTYANSDSAIINGHANFDSNATLPYGWGYPMLYGRLGEHQILTSPEGFLMMKGSTSYCANGPCKTGPPSATNKGGSKGLSGDKLGLAIGLPIAVVFVVVLVLAALLFLKRRRETEAEDGIFAVARKPEYGSALVVDDIIEETRTNKTLQAMIDMRNVDQDSDVESGSDSDRSRSVSRSRSRSRSVSRSMSRGRYDSAGESASRASDDE